MIKVSRCRKSEQVSRKSGQGGHRVKAFVHAWGSVYCLEVLMKSNVHGSILCLSRVHNSWSVLCYKTSTNIAGRPLEWEC